MPLSFSDRPADPSEYLPPEPTFLETLRAYLGAWHSADAQPVGFVGSEHDAAAGIVDSVETLLPAYEQLVAAASQIVEEWDRPGFEVSTSDSRRALRRALQALP